MTFLIGLLPPVFTQRMSPFNPLLLSLAPAQPVLMRHRGHQHVTHWRGRYLCTVGRNQGQKAGKSELSRQWTDAADGSYLALEYRLYGKSG